jgi:hypothetical protein
MRRLNVGNINVWPILIRIIGAVILFVSVQQAVAYFQSQRQLAVMNVLSDGANKINNRTPVEIDKEITLEKALAGPGRQINYFYKFTQLKASDIPDDLIDVLMKKLERSLLEEYTHAPMFKTMRETEVHAVYSFSDSTDKPLFDVRIGPAQ